jgi:CheY-like chemotaxis protein
LILSQVAKKKNTTALNLLPGLKGSRRRILKRNNTVGDLRENNQRILIVDDQSFNIEALLIILKYTMGLDTDKYCE